MIKQHNFELDYIALIEDILENGERREGRNGTTISVFGRTFTVDMSDTPNEFPLLLGRKMFYRGVFGEFAAFLRGPKNVKDFEDMGCNYWKQWEDNDDGDITVDYGNLWLDFDGVNQLDVLRESLKNNPMDRRMLISGWNPANLSKNSLPCCHLLYQWYVRDGDYLDMVWYQRSVDTMVGLPSDIILAAIWNVLLANECGYKPGKLIFNLGDTHIYEEHLPKIQEYKQNRHKATRSLPVYGLGMVPGEKIENFTPDKIQIVDYNPGPVIKFEVKA